MANIIVVYSWNHSWPHKKLMNMSEEYGLRILPVYRLSFRFALRGRGFTPVDILRRRGDDYPWGLSD